VLGGGWSKATLVVAAGEAQGGAPCCEAQVEDLTKTNTVLINKNGELLTYDG